MASKSLPTNMRAAAWSSSSGGLERNVRYTADAKLPKNANPLPKDSLLIKNEYSSLNPVDYKMAELPLLSGFMFSKPMVPCADFAGRVVESSADGFKPGDAVFGETEPPNFGALAEYIVVSKGNAAHVPDGVSLKDAATIGIAGLTAYQTIAPFVKAGGKVLINGGSGGTGTYGIQIAKAMGCEVTTTCSGANVELCKSLGADVVIDYRTNDIVSTLKRSGVQFDLIVDNVFAEPKLYWESHHFLKPDRPYITIAGSASWAVLKALTTILILPRFLGGGQRRFKFIMAHPVEEQYNQIATWMAEGKVRTVIEKEYDLHNAADAFAHLKSGRTKGKLVVKVSER